MSFKSNNSPGDESRSIPPHVFLGEVVCEGIMEAKPSILIGAYVHHIYTRSLAHWVPDVDPVHEHLPVDTLAHGLDRVLFKYLIFIASAFELF